MQLHFKESGRGRAVILLHGLFGSSDNWHPIASKLSGSFHVFALDQRNHGQSPHSDEMDYPLMAADVDRFMASRRLATAFVIGHSMGGKTAMQFALQSQDRVDKLIVSDMAPRVYAPAHDKIFAALLALDLELFATRQQIEAALAPEIPNLVLRRFLLKSLGRDAKGKFAWKMNLRGLSVKYPRLGEMVSAPVPFAKPALFIRGASDGLVSDAYLKAYAGLLPNARTLTIPAAGHAPHLEQPEALASAVFEFLGA